MGRARVVAGVVGIAAGVFLIVTSLWIGGFRAAAAGEVLLDHTRGEVSADGLRALRHDFDRARAATDLLRDEVLPGLATQLGVTPAQLDTALRARYPAVAKGLEQGPEIEASTDAGIANLEKHQDDFDAADSLPVWFLPLTVAPGITIGVGIVLLVLGVFVLLRPGRRGWLVGLCVAGVLLAVVPLATRGPQKASDAKSLIDSLNITQESAEGTRARFNTVVAFTRQLQDEVVPDVAQALGTTPQALVADLEQRFPLLAESKGDIASFFGRFEADVRIREEGVDEFAVIRDVPTQVIPWLSIGAGIAVALAAGIALILGRREPGPVAPVAPEDAPERSPQLVG